MPEPGRDETVRVVALDKNFHMKCYKCEVSCPFWLAEVSLSLGKPKGLANGWEEFWACTHALERGCCSSEKQSEWSWDRLQPCSGMTAGRFPADCLLLQKRPGKEQGR